jgi:hypothetical protein
MKMHASLLYTSRRDSHTKLDARAALIRVTEGKLVVQEVVSELERLIPGHWSWKVEDAGHDLFKTFFHQRMSCCAW